HVDVQIATQAHIFARCGSTKEEIHMNPADLDTNTRRGEKSQSMPRKFMGFHVSDLLEAVIFMVIAFTLLHLINISTQQVQAEEKLSQARFETQVHRMVTCFCQHRSQEARSADVLGMTLMLVLNSERLGDLPLPLLQQATKLSQEPNDMCPMDVRLDDPPQLE
ncbi:hypothetical protein KBC70_04275, partial [Candidatus Woesebacteria bacterium]|nr:hypothetical protein [Candidatus Woesebacteria bacterium]